MLPFTVKFGAAALQNIPSWDASFSCSPVALMCCLRLCIYIYIFIMYMSLHLVRFNLHALKETLISLHFGATGALLFLTLPTLSSSTLFYLKANSPNKLHGWELIHPPHQNPTKRENEIKLTWHFPGQEEEEKVFILGCVFSPFTPRDLLWTKKGILSWAS